MKNLLLPEVPLLEAGPAPSLQTLPRQFRLSVWNFQKEKQPLWRQDFLSLCEQSDLFLAQETRLNMACTQAVEQSGLHWHAAISFLSPWGKYPTGIAAGCRAPAQEIAFDASAKEPFLTIPKMSMRLVYPLQQTQLLVINIHAVNFSSISPFKHHLEKAASLVASFPGPVIVAGDFNAWNQKRHTELLHMAERLELKEVLFQPDLRTRYLHRTVDYIFVRGLQTVSSAVLELASSDHRPLTAVLRLP